MLEALEALDRAIFLFFNGLHHPWVDQFMVVVTNKYTWIPLYLWMLFRMGQKYGWASLVWILLAVALLVTLTDTISFRVFKQGFERYRPCHNLELAPLTHLVVNCSGKYGFLSGHATNSFGVAVFVAGMMAERRWWYWLLPWAALVAYSRVYVGVHYPSDIFAGALLGTAIAFFVLWAHRQLEQRYPRFARKGA